MAERLAAHLSAWLGGWPPRTAVDVIGAAVRTQPGWDGKVRPVLGVRSPDAGVLAVPPESAATVAGLASGGWAALAEKTAAAVGLPDHRWYEAVLRWSTAPALLPDAGHWVSATANGVPEWLRPFGGRVLVAEEDGVHLAGVGLKHHDAVGRELAVVTTPEARGRGLARRLVAQAARQVLADGGMPTYLHDTSNVASARVADAAGFPDVGWRVVGLWSQEPA